jgi:hypothetical protein
MRQAPVVNAIVRRLSALLSTTWLFAAGAIAQPSCRGRCRRINDERIQDSCRGKWPLRERVRRLQQADRSGFA